MQGREQKILKNNYPERNKAELEVNSGVQTYIWMNEKANTMEKRDSGILEQILSPTNLNKAYKQVVSNKGVGGIDGIEVRELKAYLIEHKSTILQSLIEGKYKPSPVKRVEIPKADGRKRKLGIPTVIDRMVQQAIHQVLSPIYEREFRENSYGFRPGRNAHQALRQIQNQVDKGYKYVVDLDLEQYFDSVNQSKLIEVLSRKIKDGRVISLIHKYLRAGVSISGKITKSEIGTPQGSPLSPLLGNIMLHELDKELERRGHEYVRYADDLMILCKSHRGAERTKTHITSYIEKKLYLKVNEGKTQVSEINKVKYLGYSFYIREGQCRLRVHPKSWERMKTRIRELTSRSNGKGDEWRKRAMKYFIVGWVNYFKLADMKSLLVHIDEWYRRRIRMVIWKQWKQTKTRYVNLQKLGTYKRKAWKQANTRKGYWHTAQSLTLACTITNARLKQAGYIYFTDYYKTQIPIT